MREARVRRRLVAACAIVGSIVAGQMLGVGHVAAATGGDCPGQYFITVPDAISTVNGAVASDSWVRTCARVDTNATPPIWGDVTVNPDQGGGTFTYTLANCIVGVMSFSDGGEGVFVGGAVVIANPGFQQEFTAVVAPLSGAPCLATSSSTQRTWSGLSNFVYA
jgi:hypothetical protein